MLFTNTCNMIELLTLIINVLTGNQTDIIEDDVMVL